MEIPNLYMGRASDAPSGGSDNRSAGITTGPSPFPVASRPRERATQVTVKPQWLRDRQG